MTLHISKGNMKIGKIPNISLVPVKDCGNCEYCKNKCYALKAWKQYPNVRNAWNENSKEFNENSKKASLLIGDYLIKHNPDYFRIHVAGDFLNQTHVDSLISICTIFTGTNFMVNTKMFDLDYSKIPKNMHLRFSMWPGMEIPDSALPKAWLDDGTDKRIPKDAFICTGKCDDCLVCYHTDKDVVFKLH